MVVRTIVAAPIAFGDPIAAAHKHSCQRCAQLVWLSDRAELADDDQVICVVCAMAVIQPGDTIEPAPWVGADLAEL